MDIEFNAALRKVTVRSEEQDSGAIARVCTLVLAMDFDDTAAAMLGSAGKKALSALRAHEYSDCTIPIDSLNCSGSLTADGETVDLDVLVGTKAKAKAGKEGEEPTVLLAFEFMFARDAWAFLGEKNGIVATVSLKSRQGTLTAVTGRKAKASA